MAFRVITAPQASGCHGREFRDFTNIGMILENANKFLWDRYAEYRHRHSV
jgi:hypothetical protein